MTKWDGKRKWHRGRHVPKNEVKVGMWLSCGDEQHRPYSACWQDDHPQYVNKLFNDITGVYHCRQDGVIDGCHCDDIDHLYEVIWDDNTTTLHEWLTSPSGIDYASLNSLFQPKTKKYLMSNIIQKVKDLALSKVDRVLRANELESEYGMTENARSLMLDEVAKERWVTRREEIAKALI